uniref:Uncharacterized protein n=1 Tax=Opuntia streptacantha TaxID=393608 RepID=A0A7C8YD03_OPUST
MAGRVTKALPPLSEVGLKATVSGPDLKTSANGPPGEVEEATHESISPRPIWIWHLSSSLALLWLPFEAPSEDFFFPPLSLLPDSPIDQASITGLCNKPMSDLELKSA